MRSYVYGFYKIPNTILLPLRQTKNVLKFLHTKNHKRITTTKELQIAKSND